MPDKITFTGSTGSEFDEKGFQSWYANWAKKLDLDPNPDAPEHHYDYRAAYSAGVKPAWTPKHQQYRWPDTFKSKDYNQVIDHQTGKPIEIKFEGSTSAEPEIKFEGSPSLYDKVGAVQDWVGKNTPLRVPMAFADIAKIPIGMAMGPIQGLSLAADTAITRDPDEAQRRTAERLKWATPEPHTPEGKLITQGAEAVMSIPQKIGNWIGEKVQDVSKGESEYDPGRNLINQYGENLERLPKEFEKSKPAMMEQIQAYKNRGDILATPGSLAPTWAATIVTGGLYALLSKVGGKATEGLSSKNISDLKNSPEMVKSEAILKSLQPELPLPPGATTEPIVPPIMESRNARIKTVENLNRITPSANQKLIPKPVQITELPKPTALPGSTPSQLITKMAERATQRGAPIDITIPETATVNMKAINEKAAKMYKDDPERVTRIAMGEEAPPQGMYYGNFFKTIEDHAVKTGDLDALVALSKAPIAEISQEAGRTIKSFDYSAEGSPVKAMRDLRKARTESVQKLHGSVPVERIKTNIVTKIKTEIKNRAPKFKDWDEFVLSMEC